MQEIKRKESDRPSQMDFRLASLVLGLSLLVSCLSGLFTRREAEPRVATNPAGNHSSATGHHDFSSTPNIYHDIFQMMAPSSNAPVSHFFNSISENIFRDLMRQHIFHPKDHSVSSELLTKFFPQGALEELYATWNPPIRFHKLAHYYVLMVDVPGISRESLHVTITKDAIYLKGKQQMCFTEAKPGDASGINIETTNKSSAAKESESEICTGRSIERTFRLPLDVNHEKASVKLRDGVLLLVLERTEGLERELPVSEVSSAIRHLDL